MNEVSCLTVEQENLFNSNMDYAKKLSHKYFNIHDDAYSIALESLLTAVRGHDSTRGAFSTYFQTIFSNDMYHYFIVKSRLDGKHIATELDVRSNLKKCIKEVGTVHYRKGSYDEAEKAYTMLIDAYLDLDKLFIPNQTSLDATGNGNHSSDNTLKNVFPSPCFSQNETRLHCADIKERTFRNSKMTDIAKDMYRRFEEGCNLSDIAKHYGLSREYVRQIFTRKIRPIMARYA